MRDDKNLKGNENTLADNEYRQRSDWNGISLVFGLQLHSLTLNDDSDQT